MNRTFLSPYMSIPVTVQPEGYEGLFESIVFRGIISLVFAVSVSFMKVINSYSESDVEKCLQ
jgi:hypothetical protein